MKNLDKKLKNIRLRYFAGLFLSSIILVAGEIYSNGVSIISFVLIGIYIALGLLSAFYARKKYYIYDYSIADQTTGIQLINMYGRTKTIKFSLNELHEVELKEKNFWHFNDRVRMHIRYSRREYEIINNGIGKQITKELTAYLKTNK